MAGLLIGSGHPGRQDDRYQFRRFYTLAKNLVLGLSDLAVLTPFLITLFGQFGGVALQLAEVVEGIGARQFAGMDQAHEQVAHFGAV